MARMLQMKTQLSMWAVIPQVIGSLHMATVPPLLAVAAAELPNPQLQVHKEAGMLSISVTKYGHIAI